MSHSFSSFALTLVASALLASCGGGGGGGGGSTPPPAGVQPVAIVEANAKPVAADALANVRNISATQGATGLPVGVQVSVGPFAGTSMRAFAVAGRLAIESAKAAALPIGVVVNQTVSCPMGGTMTLTGQVANPNVITPGDTLTVSTSACKVSDAGETMTMDGQFSMTFVSGTMDTLPFHAVLQMTMTNFRVGTGTMMAASSGDMRLDWNAVSTTSQSMTSTGNTFVMQDTMAGRMHTVTMTNYSQTLTIAGTTLTAALSAGIQTDNANVDSAGVTYTVSTPVPVTWDSVTGVVSTGTVKVTGAKNSQLTLTFTGNDNATIALDANGDGVAEKTITTTTSELGTMM